jgi:hypothetical protein
MGCMLLVAVGAASVTSQPLDGRPNLALNGSFEDGLSAWGINHAWYESPRGSGKGTSRFEVASEGARDGEQCAVVTGEDNRGIILQDVRIRPEVHRISGWVRCRGLGDARAAINVEWLTPDAEYIGGTEGGSITGDTDWTFISADLTPPENAGIARVELLTNTNNGGRAWFDDIRLLNAAEGDQTPPPPVLFRATPSAWLSGAVRLSWSSYEPPPDLAEYRIYAAEEPPADPTAGEAVCIARASAKAAVVHGLDPGQEYHVTVCPVDLYGNAADTSAAQRVIPTDARAPRLSITPLAGPTGALAILLNPPPGHALPTSYAVTTHCAGKRRSWKCAAQPRTGIGRIVASGFPHAVEVQIEAATGDDEAPGPAAVASATTSSPPDETLPRRGELCGVIVSADGTPIADATVRLTAAGVPRREVRTDEDGLFVIKSTGAHEAAAGLLVGSAEGHLSAYRNVALGTGTVRVRLDLAPREPAKWTLWTTHPLKQLFQDDDAPAADVTRIKLVAMRNERECYQLAVRPAADIGPVRVVFEDLQLESGKATLSADNFSARFLSYVHVNKNSRATPPEELVRKAPAEFPDELSDDPERPLRANVTQPIFLSFYVPSDARPGVYQGNVYLLTPLGLDPVPISLEVLPIGFPDDTRLWVVNWFSTNSFSDLYGLEAYSPEWWAMLRHYARLFRDHHQNVVTVSPGLCQIWIEEDGSVSYDWSRFDRWCELFLSEGIRRLTVTHLGSRGPGGWQAPEFVLHDRPATHRATGQNATVPVEDFAKALQAHLEEKRWLDIACQHVADEPIPINVESWKQQSARIHAAAPKLKRMDAIHVPDLRGFLELWVPQLNYFDQWYDQYHRWQQAGEFELWFYIAWVPQGKYPNRLIDTETIKPRIAHWINYLYGADGYLHWGLNHWHLPLGQFSPGDEWIVWPGRDGPNSSLRYEAQRDGLEDCEYLFMLEDAEREVIDKLGARGFDPRDRPSEIGHRVLRSMSDYTRSYDELQAARNEVAREIVIAGKAPLALVRTEPTTAQTVGPCEANVWGVTEPGCSVTVNGEPAPMDGDRFLVRTAISPDAPDVTIVVRRGSAEKRIVRHFQVSDTPR